jgi:hypothetical protein
MLYGSGEYKYELDQGEVELRASMTTANLTIRYIIAISALTDVRSLLIRRSSSVLRIF